MADITVRFEGNGGGLTLKYSSDADAFKKRVYSGLELRNMAAGLNGRASPEMDDNETYSLRSTAVVGSIKSL